MTTQLLMFEKGVHYEVTPSGCWEWLLSRDKDGYGHCNTAYGSQRAHRAVMIQKGYSIKGWNVNHKCHNRCCVNPAHLYIGSQKSNVEDCIKAGRFKSNKGTDNPRAKLNQLTAYSIRSDYASGEFSYSKLATKYGVGKSTIARVIKGEAWLGN